MFCTRCGTKNPESSANCYNCGQNMANTKSGQPPLSSEALTGERTRALAKVLVTRGGGLATEAHVERAIQVIQEIQKDAGRVLTESEIEGIAQVHLHFFSTVDRNGVTRFFDLMEENGFCLAETATSAPRLSPCPCRESVFETRDRAVFHHVHRIYCEYPRAQAAQAHLAMQMFANHFGMTHVTKIGEALGQQEAKPIWGIILQKLGCPTGRWSFKSRSIFTE